MSLEFYRNAYRDLYRPNRRPKISQFLREAGEQISDESSGREIDSNSEDNQTPRVLEINAGKKLEFMDLENSIPVTRLLTDY